MSDNQEPRLLDHNYDGIQEYDNPLPMWWLVTFLVAIIFSFIYWIHYQFGGGTTQLAELKQDMQNFEAQKAKQPEQKESEEELMALMAKPEVISAGQNLFSEKCSACHGPQAQGLIGPNLTDQYWLHGKGTRQDILAVVSKGVPEKGMPSWETMLKPDDLKSVVAYVYSLKGSHPANPKDPQGDLVE